MAPRVTATVLDEPDTAQSSLERVNEGGEVTQARCLVRSDAGTQEVTVGTLARGMSTVVDLHEPVGKNVECVWTGLDARGRFHIWSLFKYGLEFFPIAASGTRFHVTLGVPGRNVAGHSQGHEFVQRLNSSDHSMMCLTGTMQAMCRRADALAFPLAPSVRGACIQQGDTESSS